MVENQRLSEAVADLKENLNEERDENTKLSRENEKFEREVKDLRRNNNLLKSDVSCTYNIFLVTHLIKKIFIYSYKVL